MLSLVDHVGLTVAEKFCNNSNHASYSMNSEKSISMFIFTFLSIKANKVYLIISIIDQCLAPKRGSIDGPKMKLTYSPFVNLAHFKI